LAGTYGYLNLYEGQFATDPVWQTLGVNYRIEELSQKPYPSGRPTHMFVDAAKALMTRHNLKAADVVTGTCHMPPTVKALVGRPFRSGMSPNYARLCTPYCVAAVLAGGDLTQADFNPAALARAEVAALAARIDVEADNNTDPNAMAPATLILELNQGDRVEHTVQYALGHPNNPMSTQQRRDKFWACWQLDRNGPAAAQGHRLLAQVDKLESIDNVASVTGLLTTN
jgi:2-methylcitrate dehydratase PrpD